MILMMTTSVPQFGALNVSTLVTPGDIVTCGPNTFYKVEYVNPQTGKAFGTSVQDLSSFKFDKVV